MIKSILLPTLILLFFISCSSNKGRSEQNGAHEPAAKTPKSSCFALLSEKDTIVLRLKISSPHAVTGILKYNIWEKDKNEGTIKGKITGDTLLADYTFSSEGRVSVREVAFLLHGNEVTEGYGEMEEKNGKMIFTNRKNIDFSKGTKLQQIDCPENN